MKTHFIFFLTFICLTLVSCNLDKHKGIKIGADLYQNQTFKQNRELRKIIDEILDKKTKGLIEISKFECGGGAGCYDLGSVLAQTLNKIGENEFIKMSEPLTFDQKQEINSLLEAGFEYGDNDYDGKMDNTSITIKYPKLSDELNKK